MVDSRVSILLLIVSVIVLKLQIFYLGTTRNKTYKFFEYIAKLHFLTITKNLKHGFAELDNR